MSNDAIQNVRATQALRPDGDAPVDDLKNGEFVLDELQSGDIEARLKGDGVVTPSDATKRLIALNPQKDAVLNSMDNEEAALFGATLAMRHPRNHNLLAAGQKPDQPLPQGETFTLRQSDLKAALAPFKDKLDDLRAALNAMQQGTGDVSAGQSKVLGKSFTPALGLPVDPKL